MIQLIQFPVFVVEHTSLFRKSIGGWKINLSGNRHHIESLGHGFQNGGWEINLRVIGVGDRIMKLQFTCSSKRCRFTTTFQRLSAFGPLLASLHLRGFLSPRGDHP